MICKKLTNHRHRHIPGDLLLANQKPKYTSIQLSKSHGLGSAVHATDQWPGWTLTNFKTWPEEPNRQRLPLWHFLPTRNSPWTWARERTYWVGCHLRDWAPKVDNWRTWWDPTAMKCFCALFVTFASLSPKKEDLCIWVHVPIKMVRFSQGAKKVLFSVC